MKFSGADVVVLSSNFTQRGSPAVVDKFSRAAMAMSAGASLVVELPFLFACAAGQDFARGAVDIFGRTGIVERVAFGMEDPEFDFAPLVDAMSRESRRTEAGYRAGETNAFALEEFSPVDVTNCKKYTQALRRELKQGASYPKANAIALEQILPGSKEFITRPNNMLALSYILHIFCP